MKLANLLQLITPGEWRRADRGYVIENKEEPNTEAWALFALSDAQKRPIEANGDTAEMAEANALFVEHAHRVVPKALEFVNSLLDEDSLCTCMSHHSWMGEGHCSGCLCTELENLRDLLEDVDPAHTSDLQDPPPSGARYHCIKCDQDVVGNPPGCGCTESPSPWQLVNSEPAPVLGELQHTNRGFEVIAFKDRYDAQCSIQQSSIATEPCLWLGIDDPEPKIMASIAHKHGIQTDQTTGWVKFPIPDEVAISTRMHLNVETVRGLIPVLQRWVDTDSFAP